MPLSLDIQFDNAPVFQEKCLYIRSIFFQKYHCSQVALMGSLSHCPYRNVFVLISSVLMSNQEIQILILLTSGNARNSTQAVRSSSSHQQAAIAGPGSCHRVSSAAADLCSRQPCPSGSESLPAQPKASCSSCHPHPASTSRPTHSSKQASRPTQKATAKTWLCQECAPGCKAGCWIRAVGAGNWA